MNQIYKFCFGLPGPSGDLRDRRLQLLLCPLSVECVTKGFRTSCQRFMMLSSMGRALSRWCNLAAHPSPWTETYLGPTNPKIVAPSCMNSTVTAAYLACKDFPKSSFSSLCISSWRRNLPIWWVCPLSTLRGLDFMARVLQCCLLGLYRLWKTCWQRCSIVISRFWQMGATAGAKDLTTPQFMANTPRGLQ